MNDFIRGLVLVLKLVCLVMVIYELGHRSVLPFVDRWTGNKGGNWVLGIFGGLFIWLQWII